MKTSKFKCKKEHKNLRLNNHLQEKEEVLLRLYMSYAQAEKKQQHSKLTMKMEY